MQVFLNPLSVTSATVRFVVCVWFSSLLLVAGCVESLPKPTPFTPLIGLDRTPDEQQLLDVGIVQFQSDLTAVEDIDLHYLLARIREAETRYMPFVLKETLHHGEQWGDIRILLDGEVNPGVIVHGKVIESNGHTLQLHIRVEDASNALWFEQDYAEHVGDNIYGDNILGVNDPFQGLYTRIANDMLQYREAHLNGKSITELKALANVQFARRFAPSMFNAYITIDESNRYRLIGLPAIDDPIATRIERIKVRDDLFHALMQQHYANFARQVGKNYYQWRYADYLERKRLRDQQVSASGDILLGTLYLGAAVALGDASNLWRKLGAIGVAVKGAQVISVGLDELNVSQALLEETAASFADAVSTRVIELEDRTVSLSGTVEDQYRQWREILENIYAMETGIEPAADDLTPSLNETLRRHED